MEKDELPSANEQMGMYRQQTRPRDDDVSLEAINDYVKERFMAPSQGYAEVGDDQATEVGQQGLQPTPQDPKLWLVECKTGSEREAVVSLMQKCVDLHAKRTPLAIKAVFTQDHLKVSLTLVDPSLPMTDFHHGDIPLPSAAHGLVSASCLTVPSVRQQFYPALAACVKTVLHALLVL